MKILQVRADLADHSSANISVLTNSIPSVWVATDHLCIVWCKQVYYNDSTFLKNQKNKTITVNVQNRENAEIQT